ncbi:MAG: ABC transporter substrate-binding protein [Candidatus Omnitrophica bacterium]|nr:ABC transporter substrate-binding protein [Candidatus Omnitrophota bacterium]MBI2174616.1 ABC transporter substrate-binding protein [Candidatus Omnitrophota bacterium]
MKSIALPKTITVGHTPDMDDAFMFYAINSGHIPMDGLRFEHVIEDIQSLNQRALRGELDMTAISAASYPALSSAYWIVSVGSSIGQGYGPLVIAQSSFSPEELSGRRIAVPGCQTTAYFLLRLAIPSFEPVEMPFSEIPQAVLDGSVAAGLVIHEWQLIYRDAGLLPILDLGIWWQTHMKLPLPLGLNVVKKSLGKKTAQQTAAALRDSILYAFAHQEDALEYAMQYGRGTDAARARQFIGMYVNEESLILSTHTREALRLLFDHSKKAGLISQVPRLGVICPFAD